MKSKVLTALTLKNAASCRVTPCNLTFALFDSRPRHQLSWLIFFVVFLSPSEQKPIMVCILTYWQHRNVTRRKMGILSTDGTNSMAWVRERTIETERPLVSEDSANFADIGYHVVSVTDPYGRILGSLDRSSYFSSKLLLSCTHEAEWTPFQTHYCSKNLVAPGIEPGLLDLQPGILTTRPQRLSIARIRWRK
jgi:hypothetical protein